MITKEQFEAHVRAEADKKHPVKEVGRPPMLNEIGYWVTYDENREIRATYIAARMEHEWPLVEALQGLVEDVSCVDPGVYDIEFAKAALSPYTTKPIGR